MVCSIVSVGAAEKHNNSFLDVRGVDVSSYISLKNSGVDFYDFDGNKLTDNQYFDFLKSCGINYVRIRIWNNPYDENGRGYGGGNCDLQNAVTIGKLASEISMKVFAIFIFPIFGLTRHSNVFQKRGQVLISGKNNVLYMIMFFQALKH